MLEQPRLSCLPARLCPECCITRIASIALEYPDLADLQELHPHENIVRILGPHPFHDHKYHVYIYSISIIIIYHYDTIFTNPYHINIQHIYIYITYNLKNIICN